MQKWLYFLLITFAFCSCKRDIQYEAADAKVIRTPNGKLYASVEIDLLEKRFDTPLGLQVHSFGAFEVYWDKTLIGRNGIPGQNDQNEVPGTENSYYQVPDQLSQTGKHMVEIKGSQVYQWDAGRTVMAKPESYLKLLRQPLIELSLVNLMAGAFLIAAIYYFLLYVNSQKKLKTNLLFAVICLLFFLLLAMEYIKAYIDIPYTWFYARLKIVGWLTAVIAFFIPLYFTIYYQVPNKKTILILTVTTLLFITLIEYGHYDLIAHLHSLTWWLASVIILAYAVVKKLRGSILVLVIFLAAMVVNQYLFYDFGLYIGFTMILLGMLYLQTVASKQLELLHQESQLLSSRLQLELIKKNIQPHFLRNTLTSLIDWVEETPAEGVKMIKALSAEFDLMMAMSEQSLVPVSQEIALCKRHLEVMHFRKEVDYSWTDNLSRKGQELIPPAILLTLVENGITHMKPKDNQLIFRLTYQKENRHTHYTLECEGENRERQEHDGGQGFQYIRARLTESYGSKWTFNALPTTKGWQNHIIISE